MKLLLEAGGINSRSVGVVTVSAFVILSTLFAARTPVTQITQVRPTTPAHAQSTNALGCTTLGWTQLSPTGTGPDLNSQAFVSDGKGNLIMFGGCGPSGCNTSNTTFVLRDAFGFAGTTSWLQLSTSGGPPSARHAHVLAYDSHLNELIVSGGCAGGCFPLATDMWSLSNANGLDVNTTPTWTSRGSAPNASYCVGQFAATDSVHNVMMIFGGQNGGGSACGTSSSTETVNTSTFAVATLGTSGGPPGEQYFAHGGYDPVSNELIVSNGSSCSDSDLWALTNANGSGGTPTWSDLLTQGGANQPPVGGYPSTYSAELNTVFLLEQVDTTKAPNLWRLSNANGFDSSNNPATPVWSKTTPTGAPASGSIGAIAYDLHSNRLVVQVSLPSAIQYWIISCSSPAQCAPPPTGMISWWPAEGNADDIVSHNNGTLQGGATFGVGEVGQGFSFDGVDDYVFVPDSPSLNYTDFTYDAWITPDPSSPAGDNYIIHKGVSHYYVPLIFMGGGAGAHSWEAIIDGTILVGGPVTYGFQHVAVTRQGNVGRLYVDGILRDTQTVGTGSAAGYNLTFGRITDYGTAFFKGRIDEVEIFNRALSQVEIAQIYLAGSAGKCRSCLTPPSNMVAWWPGDGNTKDTAGGNNGLLKNGATFGTGEVGQAFSFNGTNAAVEVPNNSAWDFGSNDFTIDTWVKFNSTQTNQVLLAHDEAAGPTNKWILYWTGSALDFLFNPPFVQITVPFSPSTGQWYHVVLTRSGTTYKFYVNGSQIGGDQTDSNSIPSANAPLTLGYAEANYALNGLLDEVEIFNRALSAGEIQNIYDAGSLGKCKPVCVTPPSGLIGWWPGDNTAVDIQSGNNAILNGVSFANGKVDRAFSFDGTDDDVTVTGAPDPNNAFSFDLWVYWAGHLNPTGYEGILVKSYSNFADAYGTFIQTSDNSLYNSFSGGGGVIVSTAPNSVPMNQWFHLAQTYDGTTVRVYINGNLAASGSVSHSPSNGPLVFGNRFGGPHFFHGLLDEIEIFNRALTADEVAAIYNAGSAGKCKTARFYVSNYNSQTIDEFDDGGNYVARFADANSNFGTPFGLAFDSSGNLFVTYSLGSSVEGSIQKYDALGNPSFFGSILGPYGDAFDGAGNLYAAEYFPNFDILKFTPAGTSSLFAGSSSGLSRPTGLALNETGDLLFVANYGANNVLAFDLSGVIQHTYASGLGFNGPNGIAFDGNGNFFVANYKNSSITKIDSGGAASVFANSGLAGPIGLTFFNGNSYAVNLNNDTIEKFDSNGNGTLFASGAGLSQPIYIAVKEISPTAACVQFSSRNYSVNETDGSVTLTVTRNGNTSGSSTVHYATANGTAVSPTNYTATSGDLTFNANDTTKTVQVSLPADSTDPCAEDNESFPKTFSVALSNTSGAMLSGPATASVTINHDDAGSEPQFTISVSAAPSAGGTVSGGGNYSCGAQVTVTATANSCYNFVNWTEGSTVVSTSASYSFTASSNRTLVANFSKIQYTISASASPSAGGSVSGAGTYDCGSTVNLTATANSCYNFVNWTEGNTVVSTSSTYSFTASSNRTLVAHFAKIQYTISASASPGAGGSVSGTGTYDCGSTVNLTAIANSCYGFVNWTENGSVVSTSVTYSFTASSNRTLVANFTQTDTTAPFISTPEQIVVRANARQGRRGPRGAFVSFSVSAFDQDDGSVPAIASPPSGSFFPIGTTTVTVTASDPCGNMATKTFTVTVKSR